MARSTVNESQLDASSSTPAASQFAPTIARRSSRAEAVAEAVESQIATKKLLPGTHLGTRRELGEILSVAPSTVSEAIKLLEDRGRVVTRTGPGGGVFVAEPGVRLRLARSIMLVSGSEGEVADALEVRDALESAVIVSAASRRHEPAALAPMLRALAGLGDATDTADFFRRNLEFHNEVATLCGNAILGTIYRSLLELVRARDPKLALLPGQNRSKLHKDRVQVHREIADAIVAGDVVAAQSAAAAHAKQGQATVDRAAH